jgi:hypothetical protein
MDFGGFKVAVNVITSEVLILSCGHVVVSLFEQFCLVI